MKGALSLAECKTEYKVDCTLILNNGRGKKIFQSLINFYVISSNINHKIPKDDLHEALKEGGAQLVETDNIKYKMWSGSNNGESGLLIKQNLHLASLKV